MNGPGMGMKKIAKWGGGMWQGDQFPGSAIVQVGDDEDPNYLDERS